MYQLNCSFHSQIPIFLLLLENVEILANHEWSCWGELCSLFQWHSVAFPCWEGRINKAKKNYSFDNDDKNCFHLLTSKYRTPKIAKERHENFIIQKFKKLKRWCPQFTIYWVITLKYHTCLKGSAHIDIEICISLSYKV